MKTTTMVEPKCPPLVMSQRVADLLERTRREEARLRAELAKESQARRAEFALD